MKLPDEQSDDATENEEKVCTTLNTKSGPVIFIGGLPQFGFVRIGKRILKVDYAAARKKSIE